LPEDHKNAGDGWNELSPSSLVEECIRGRQAAWDEFLDRYGPLIRGTIIRKLSSLGCAGTDAEDVFQDVFRSLIENDCRALSSIKNPEKIESWLCATALHKTIDFMRGKIRNDKSSRSEARGGHSYAAETQASYSPSGVETKERAEQVRLAVGRLRPEEQLLIKWYYVHGLKYREIAELADISINTVSSRLFRIKKKLSRRLGELET
jgi:RNA polymerase sigma-70 factor (ECF subfamily)